ncbi:MAG: selenocysteine-specific elongation factor [Kiritimatiellia bacterium]|jgi:selenocysteine-specific elongation factor
MSGHYIVATAGHVDHGKSALVNALSGIDPDRLPEEKSRGMTIDLGFAHVDLDDLHLALIDVPGHEDFVKNMIAGIGSIDLALLIVASDDGWMPQTEEHLQILQYLGVKQLIVVLTKADLAGELADLALEEVCEQLAGTPYEDAPSIKTAALSGEGIPELKQLLKEQLMGMPQQRDIGKPRLYVDRAFSRQGLGTVVTGTLTGGSLQKDQEVVVYPERTASRIRSLQNHNEQVEVSGAGTRTALNLRDIEIAGKQRSGIKRGHVITLPELGEPSRVMGTFLFRTNREHLMAKGALQPIRHGARVRVHHGSSNLPARVFLLEDKEILPGQSGVAQLRFDDPCFSFSGDHFIVRDWPEQFTLAGGIMLDPHASKKRYRDVGNRAYLEACAASAEDLALRLQAELAFHKAVSAPRLLSQSLFSKAAIDEVREQLGLITESGMVFDPAYWQDLKRKVAERIDTHHANHPELAGLKTVLLQQLDIPEHLLPIVLKRLCSEGFVQVGPVIRRESHNPNLPPELERAAEQIRAALGEKPLEPPSRKDLSPDDHARKALQFLIDIGEVVDLGQDVCIMRTAVASASDRISQFIASNGPATASDLRKALETTRRVAMPLLEYLDEVGVTRRDGDVRILKPV